MQPDLGDKDTRCPMHLAAAEVSHFVFALFNLDYPFELEYGQAWILATSYLLGISANPNIKGKRRTKCLRVDRKIQKKTKK